MRAETIIYTPQLAKTTMGKDRCWTCSTSRLIITLWLLILQAATRLKKTNGDLDLCITLPHSIHTEYYAEAWGVSKEGVSSEEKAKKWIVHVKIGKSRGDRLRRVGRNSILKGWEGDQCTSTDRQAVPVFYHSYEEAVSIRFGRSIYHAEDVR